jgi:hypothetical protein
MGLLIELALDIPQNVTDYTVIHYSATVSSATAFLTDATFLTGASTAGAATSSNVA